MWWQRILLVLVAVAVVAGLAAGGYFTRDRWWPLLAKRFTNPPETAAKTAAPAPEGPKVLQLGKEARKNLGLAVKKTPLQTYWRKIQVPGIIVDRPGRSDRGVTSPAVGVISQVHAFPGDTVKPGDRLFTLRVFSEYLQNTQSELFKAAQELQLLKDQRPRLASATEGGAVQKSKLVELDQQIRRQTTAIKAWRQDLLTRGFAPEQVDKVGEGSFVSTIEVRAPPPVTDANTPELQPVASLDSESPQSGLVYEVQEHKVGLGQQVQAGEVLCVLANHFPLYIKGHAFKQEAPFLERAAQNGWPILVEFAEDDATAWPTLDQTFQIRHLANTIDPESRTFDFFVPLTNQSRSYQKDNRTFVTWRFRPGQRVRLHVPVEEMQNVLVLPVAGITREGPEAFAFQQNGDLFIRWPVHILHEDRLSVVVAVQGEIRPKMYLAQNGAASLNRVLKSQQASGEAVGVHVHADGTVHGPGAH